jgi:hypothetical protein
MRAIEDLILAYEDIQDKTYLVNPPLLGIRIRMLLVFPDPYPLVGCTDPDLSIIKHK